MMKIQRKETGEIREVSRREWETNEEYILLREKWEVKEEGDPGMVYQIGQKSVESILDREHAERMIQMTNKDFSYEELNIAKTQIMGQGKTFFSKLKKLIGIKNIAIKNHLAEILVGIIITVIAGLIILTTLFMIFYMT